MPPPLQQQQHHLLAPPAASPLFRHSSSPAGLLSRLMTDPHGAYALSLSPLRKRNSIQLALAGVRVSVVVFRLCRD